MSVFEINDTDHLQIVAKLNAAKTERDKEVLLDNYRKMARGVKGSLKDWVFQRQYDIIQIAKDYRKINQNLEGVSSSLQGVAKLLTKIEEMNKVNALNVAEQNVGFDESMVNTSNMDQSITIAPRHLGVPQKGGLLNNSMILGEADTSQFIGVAAGGDDTTNDPVLSLLKSTAKMNQIKKDQNRNDILFKSRNYGLSPNPSKQPRKSQYANISPVGGIQGLEDNQNQGNNNNDDDDEVSNVLGEQTIEKLLEEFELAILAMDLQNGSRLIVDLERQKKNIRSFQVKGKYLRLRRQFFESMNFATISQDDLVEHIQEFEKIGLRQESETLFFKAYAYFLEKERSEGFKKIKNSKGVIDDLDKICQMLAGVLDFMTRVVNIIKKKFTFQGSKGFSSQFGYWCAQEIQATYSEILTLLADEYLENWKSLDKFEAKMQTIISSYDTKGVSTGFVLDELLHKVKSSVGYYTIKKEEQDFVSSEEIDFDEGDYHKKHIQEESQEESPIKHRKVTSKASLDDEDMLFDAVAPSDSEYEIRDSLGTINDSNLSSKMDSQKGGKAITRSKLYTRKRESIKKEKSVEKKIEENNVLDDSFSFSDD